MIVSGISFSILGLALILRYTKIIGELEKILEPITFVMALIFVVSLGTYVLIKIFPK